MLRLLLVRNCLWENGDGVQQWFHSRHSSVNLSLSGKRSLKQYRLGTFLKKSLDETRHHDCTKTSRAASHQHFWYITLVSDNIQSRLPKVMLLILPYLKLTARSSSPAFVFLFRRAEVFWTKLDNLSKVKEKRDVYHQTELADRTATTQHLTGSSCKSSNCTLTLCWQIALNLLFSVKWELRFCTWPTKTKNAGRLP